MKTPYLSSFGARRSEGGFGQRSAWTMWVVAALLAVLATALPLHRPVSADDPVFTVNVTNIEYETATASLTITGFPSTIDFDNWIVRVNYSSPSDSYGTSLDAGPGLDRPDHDDDLDGEVDEPDEGGDDFVAVRNGTQITADNISMVKLVPDSEHTIEVTLYEVHSGGSWLNRGKGSETFDSKGGCYVHTDINGDPDPDNDPAHDPKGPNNLRPKWFGGSFDFSKRTETELTLDVFVTNSGLAGVNSGRCIYYSYRARGGADRGPFSAYVYTKSGGRRAWIKLTGLEMGTTYDFTVSFHPTLQDGNVGTQGTTLGARMAVRSVIVDNIEQTSARATIAVDNEGNQTHTVYYRYFKTADEADTNLHVNGNADTVKGPIVFNLSGLTATTEYKVEASLKSGFPTNQSEFDIFPTKPNKPIGLTVTPDDKELEVSWTKAVDGDAIDEYLVQWKSGNETFADAETENREQTVAHVSGTTTYETIISGLDNGTLYTVQVIAKNESGQAISDTETGTPDVLPEKPTIQSVAEGHTQLVVTWEEPANRGSDITDYVVQWKSGIETFTDAETDNREEMVAHVSGTTTYDTIIPGLDNGTEYTVRVRAVNGLVLPDEDKDDYNWSDEETGTPRPAPTVTGVTVAKPSITRTTATAIVAIDNKTGESQTVHLRHRVNTSGSSWTDATPKDTAGSSRTFDLSSLTGNTEYLVEAWLASSSTVKRSVTFTTGPVEPDPPTITDIKHGDRKLTVTWTKPGDGGSSITGYKIQWTVKGQNSWTSKTVGDPNALEGSTDQVLTNGTEYTVQVLAVNSVGDSQPSNHMHETPSTIPKAPTITEITGGNERLVVEWDEPDNGGNAITEYTVQWRSGIETFADAATDNRQATVTTLTTLTHTIQNLANDTLYTVQVRARNRNEFGPWSAEDTGTPRPDPSIDSITVADSTKTQTTAIAIVNIAHPTGELKMVHLRYRINSSSETWTIPGPQSTTISSVEFPTLTPLKSDTEYRVEGSFDSNFDSGVQFKLFTTNRPTVSDVEVAKKTIKQTSATATVTILNPNGNSQTVYLRYRPVTQTEDWSTTASDAGEDTGTSSSTTTADIDIRGLKSDTEYEVEVSLESDYSQSDKTTFTTDTPTLTGITISEVMQQSAKATIDIEEPHRRSLPIYVQYRKVTDPVNTDWSRNDTSSTSDTAVSTFSDLTSGTVYEAQASLKSDFPDEETVTSDTFKTKDPSLSGLTPMDLTMTGATIKVDIQAPNSEPLTINYRYRPVSQTDWTTTATDAGTSSTDSEANSESASFALLNLNSSTQYEVQVSLDSDLDSPTATVLKAKFTTSSPDSSISDFEISKRSQTSATVTVTVTNPDTNGNTVHLRHKVVGASSWSAPFMTDDSDPNEAEFNITGLTENTTYDVEVSLDSGFANSTTFTLQTLPYPTISSVVAEDITKTTATANISIANPDDTLRTVYLQYRKKDATPEDEWSDPPLEDDSDTSSASIPLGNLDPGTTYEVEVSFDSNFVTGVEDTEFTTKYLPSISSVRVDSDTITKTTATAIVSIANPDDIERTVYLQFRKKDATPEDEWSDPPLEEATDTGSASIPMRNLDAGTEYEVQASFDDTFPENGTKETEFTTQHIPRVSGVRVDPNSITKTTATAEVSVANPDGSEQIVHLRYIVHSATPDWDNDGTKVTTTSDTGTAEKLLENLIAGTTYILQASFGDTFPDDATKQTTFTTEYLPSVSGVTVDPNSITKNTATATVSIANPDGSEQIVHLQYRRENAAADDAWESEQPKSSRTGSATFPLSSLTEGTTYDVQVWLARDTSRKVTTTFTTAQDAPPPQQNNPPPQRTPQNPTPPPQQLSPEVASVSVTNETQTTADATVKIDNAGTAKNTVNLRYSVDGEDSWTDHTETEAGSAVEFPLSSLTAGTAYGVEAWLGSDTDNKVTATFTTSMAPSISSIDVGGITKTSATATVNIANPGDAQNTVNLRYSVDGEDSWTDHTETETGSIVEFPLSSLTAGTAYEVEAWLGSDTDNKVTATFTTSMAPSISSIDVGGITKTSATATVNIANPGDAQNTVNLRYSVDGEDSWTDHTEAETGSAVEFPLSSLTAGTAYEVEAWLGSDTDNKVTATFTTSMAPSISSIDVGGITKTSATATVNIANPGDAQNTVNLRYSVDGEDSWTDHTEAETGSIVEASHCQVSRPARLTKSRRGWEATPTTR